jgi:hypothetical protein
MKQRRFRRHSLRNRPWQAAFLLLIAATFIAIGLRGTVTAATCTSTVFAGNGFTVRDTTDGRGNGTASVSGCDGDITTISVTLNFTPPNTLPNQGELDLLLVHPNGTNNLVFFSDIGLGSTVFNGTITLADSGSTCPPREGLGIPLAPGTYKPADYNVQLDDFEPAAPPTKFSAGAGCTGANGTQSFASAFSGLSANGTWTLYAYDDTSSPPVQNYTVTWSLTITTSTTEAQVETFTATPFSEARIQLRWQTGYEVDNLGFNIHRDQNGQRIKLNPSLIAGSALLAGPGTALTAGRSYVWWDKATQRTEGARYWLEDIDLSGQST